VFGHFEFLPRLFDVVDEDAVLGCVLGLVQGFQQGVDVKVEGFDFAAFFVSVE
jgi:hypothetical protein